MNLTGAVGVAEAKELESRPVTSATQALQGLVPGLQISTNTGEMDKICQLIFVVLVQLEMVPVVLH